MPWFCLALLRAGRSFHSSAGNLRFCHHRAPGRILFCIVASHLWLPISRSHFLYGERSFLCRGSVSCSSSHVPLGTAGFEYCPQAFLPVMNRVPSSRFHFFVLCASLTCLALAWNPASLRSCTHSFFECRCIPRPVISGQFDVALLSA